MICFRCMNTCSQSICEHCGFDMKGYISPMTALKPGVIIHNRYVVGIVIGEGGFGITYVGYDNTTRRKVAIKEYYPHEISTRNTQQSNEINVNMQYLQYYSLGVQKFYNEAMILKQLSNQPNIVKVYDFFEENNTAYIVMEYIDGSRIDKVVQNQGPLNLDLVLTIYYPILEVLDKVHDAGILHRDISPSNILLDSDVKPRLIDFGASRAYSEYLSTNMTVILKEGFAPCEQYSKRANHGPAEDIYALSASMYYTLTGKVPPAAPDRLQFDTLKPLGAFTNEVSPELESVIMKGMAVRMSDRYHSARQMIEAIDEAISINNKPISEPNETDNNNKRKNIGNLSPIKWLLIGLGTACFILMIILIILLSK